jgi:hypothetical protein
MPFAIPQFWQSTNIQVRVRSVSKTVNHRNPQILDVFHQSFGYTPRDRRALLPRRAISLNAPAIHQPLGPQKLTKNVIPNGVRDLLFRWVVWVAPTLSAFCEGWVLGFLAVVAPCFQAGISGSTTKKPRHSERSSRSEDLRPFPRLRRKESLFDLSVLLPPPLFPAPIPTKTTRSPRHLLPATPPTIVADLIVSSFGNFVAIYFSPPFSIFCCSSPAGSGYWS